MRLALVSPYDLGVPGGVQSHVASLATALRAGGDEVVILAPGDGRGPLGGYAGTGASLRVPFNGSVAPIGPGARSAVRTRRYLAEIRPDVVHVHEPLVPAVGLAAALTSGAPVVATFHAWSTDVGAYRLVRPVGRRVLDGLAASLAVSDAAAGYHAAALGVTTDRFEVVPNGVDVARFAGVPDRGTSRRDGSETLLFVGRLEPRKGLATLIDAFVRLRSERPALRMLVVGEGPERARCEAALPETLRRDVRFLGRVDDEALVAAHAESDLYVSPALGGESFGIVLLEAMAAGRAVVASDLPGYRSVVTPDHNGLLVPPGDATALAAGIGSLLDDPDRRSAMAASGRVIAAAHDWPVVAQRLRSVYERVLRH